MTRKKPGPHYVYRVFDADGALIYVGCTQDLFARLKAHGWSSKWASEASRVSAKVYSSRNAALAAEKQAIQSEHPSYNVAGRPIGRTRCGVWTELKVIRERTGYSVRGLAEVANIAYGHLCDLENGWRWPTAAVTKKLADALRVPYTMLERPAEQKNSESVA